MATNATYAAIKELPGAVPVFPLAGAILLPRGELPLNVFEPRYVTMIEDALADPHRMIGMIQPRGGADEDEETALSPIGCVGRITQFAESGDGRYLIVLTGISRFRVAGEIGTVAARGGSSFYRRCAADYTPFAADLEAGRGADAVDRDGLLKTFSAYLDAHEMRIDWDDVGRAPNETLVNALSMMSPFEPREKQALVEAPDLATRAAMLVALAERATARATDDEKPLQ